MLCARHKKPFFDGKIWCLLISCFVIENWRNRARKDGKLLYTKVDLFGGGSRLRDKKKTPHKAPRKINSHDMRPKNVFSWVCCVRYKKVKKSRADELFICKLYLTFFSIARKPRNCVDSYIYQPEVYLSIFYGCPLMGEKIYVSCTFMPSKPLFISKKILIKLTRVFWI